MQSRRISELVILEAKEGSGKSRLVRQGCHIWSKDTDFVYFEKKKFFFKVKEVSPCQYKNHHIGLIPLLSEDSNSEKAHKGQCVKV